MRCVEIEVIAPLLGVAAGFFLLCVLKWRCNPLARVAINVPDERRDQRSLLFGLYTDLSKFLSGMGYFLQVKMTRVLMPYRVLEAGERQDGTAKCRFVETGTPSRIERYNHMVEVDLGSVRGSMECRNVITMLLKTSPTMSAGE
jgi:hypothetical protein